MLSRTLGCVRLVWNKTLAERQRRQLHRRAGADVVKTDRRCSERLVAHRRPGVPERSVVRAAATALRHQHTAFQNFFKVRARYPKFKSRNGKQSAHYTRSAFRMKPDGLWLAKTSAPLRLAWSWPDIDMTDDVGGVDSGAGGAVVDVVVVSDGAAAGAVDEALVVLEIVAARLRRPVRAARLVAA